MQQHSKTRQTYTHTQKKKKVGKRKKKEEEELFTRPQESKRADASSTGAHNERKGEE